MDHLYQLQSFLALYLCGSSFYYEKLNHMFFLITFYSIDELNGYSEYSA